MLFRRTVAEWIPQQALVEEVVNLGILRHSRIDMVSQRFDDNDDDVLVMVLVITT